MVGNRKLLSDYLLAKHTKMQYTGSSPVSPKNCKKYPIHRQPWRRDAASDSGYVQRTSRECIPSDELLQGNNGHKLQTPSSSD